MLNRCRVATVALAVGALAAVAPATSAFAAPGGSPSSPDRLVFNTRPPHIKSPLAAGTVRPSLTPEQCLGETQGAFACQTPDSIRAAYGIPSTVNGAPAGTGQTIVIVDAFGSPTVSQDLKTFSTAFGLPDANLNVIYPNGKPTWQGTANQVQWAAETSLDVQWAHAVAPGATIDLVVAPSSYGDSLNLAQRYVVDHHLGNVMSLSFGAPESLIHGNNAQAAQAHKIYQDARTAGITVFASSGDSGSDNGAGYANFGFPAADPLVTAVGGTNLYVGSGLTAPRETVWGDYADCPLTCADGPFGATGGAPSVLGGKNGSDVSYNASVYTGVLTYLGFLNGDSGFYFFGGTSAGSPQWAASIAVIDQAVGRSLGYVRDQLAGWAQNTALFDVVSGRNSTPSFQGGYSATAGSDLPTGYGSPNVERLIALLRG
jgi:subtilase family serine protease